LTLRARERWFGATGRRVPEIALEGSIGLEGALVLDSIDDLPRLREAHERGTPVVVRASSVEAVKAALSRPEVACALVIDTALLELDLRSLTYDSSNPVATYSICACDLDAGQWGVATQSKFLAVGSVVPWAEPHVGAIATQSYANARYGPDGLALLREELSANEVVDRLTSADAGRDQRQLGIVDGKGRSATFTGATCHAWAGGRNGPCYAAQGNILASHDTVDALVVSFEGSAGRPLAERLLDCLDAAQLAGGDRRGQQSAALLVVEQDGGYAGLSDALVDLRVDDHAQPIAELRRLFELHETLFGKTPAADWITIDDPLRAEIAARLASLGHPSLADWAGVANLEERIAGDDRIDPVVLATLRGAT
jgi:uncharacterized Ntn-hydrolase superfamily protein